MDKENNILTIALQYPGQLSLENLKRIDIEKDKSLELEYINKFLDSLKESINRYNKNLPINIEEFIKERLDILQYYKDLNINIKQ